MSSEGGTIDQQDHDDDQLAGEEPAQIAEMIVKDSFKEWYRQYQIAQNIEAGKAYFNGPPQAKPPDEFRASELLQCHRKIYYKHHVAPAENGLPEGQFFFGNQYEHELTEEFLRDAVDLNDRYIENDKWARVILETDLGEITVNGSTDPVVVDEEGVPILPTEIKTTSSIEYRTSPSEHHLAQIHAYMIGLSDRWAEGIDHGVLLYADRDTLDTRAFDITFDSDFWNDRVLDWLKTNTFYRVFGLLPPGESEQDWECDYCAYKHRCGKGKSPHGDENPGGFVPMVSDYPRSKVKEYLDAHDDALLTPTLAHEYPSLTTEYGVHDWTCSACSVSYRWDEIEWDGEAAPMCPRCEDRDADGRLRGPTPSEQHSIEVVDRPDDLE